MWRLLLSLALSATLVLSQVASGSLLAEDDLQVALDRASELIKIPVPPNPYSENGKYSRIREEVANTVHDSALKAPSREIAQDIKQFICAEQGSTPLTWRYEQIAIWQHKSGLIDDSHATLREAIPLVEHRFLNPPPPPVPDCSGAEMLNDAEQLAKAMLELGSSDADIRLAMKYAPLSNKTFRFAGTLALTAAKKQRHELAKWLADRETLAYRRALAWGMITLTYAGAGDKARAMQASKHMQTDLAKVPESAMKEETLLWLSSVGVVMYGYGEKQLGIEMIEQTKLSNHPSPMERAITWMNLGELDRANACLEEAAQHRKRTRPSLPRVSEEQINQDIEIEQNLAIALGLSNYEEALKWIDKIPADHYARLAAINGRVYRLLRIDHNAKEARRLLEENLPIYEAIADLRPRQGQNYSHYVLPQYAEYLAQVGSIDLLEKRVLPKLIYDERQQVSKRLPRYYNHLSLDEKLARFIPPDASLQDKLSVYFELRQGTNDPREVKRLDKLAEQWRGRTAWADANDKLSAAWAHSPTDDPIKNRQPWEEALAEIELLQNPYQRVTYLQRFTIAAWTHGYPDLTRAAAHQMIDVLWQTRDQEIPRLTPAVRQGWAEDAKLLLEEVDLPSRDSP